jgi:hypothetical protein
VRAPSCQTIAGGAGDAHALAAVVAMAALCNPCPALSCPLNPLNQPHSKRPPLPWPPPSCRSCAGWLRPPGTAGPCMPALAARERRNSISAGQRGRCSTMPRWRRSTRCPGGLPVRWALRCRVRLQSRFCFTAPHVVARVRAENDTHHCMVRWSVLLHAFCAGAGAHAGGAGAHGGRGAALRGGGGRRGGPPSHCRGILSRARAA